MSENIQWRATKIRWLKEDATVLHILFALRNRFNYLGRYQHVVTWLEHEGNAAKLFTRGRTARSVYALALSGRDRGPWHTFLESLATPESIHFHRKNASSPLTADPETDEDTPLTADPETDEDTPLTADPETDEDTLLTADPETDEDTLLTANPETDEDTLLTEDPETDEDTLLTEDPETDEDTPLTADLETETDEDTPLTADLETETDEDTPLTADLETETDEDTPLTADLEMETETDEDTPLTEDLETETDEDTPLMTMASMDISYCLELDVTRWSTFSLFCVRRAVMVASAVRHMRKNIHSDCTLRKDGSLVLAGKHGIVDITEIVHTFSKEG